MKNLSIADFLVPIKPMFFSKSIFTLIRYALIVLGFYMIFSMFNEQEFSWTKTIVVASVILIMAYYYFFHLGLRFKRNQITESFFKKFYMDINVSPIFQEMNQSNYNYYKSIKRFVSIDWSYLQINKIMISGAPIIKVKDVEEMLNFLKSKTKQTFIADFERLSDGIISIWTTTTDSEEYKEFHKKLQLRKILNQTLFSSYENCQITINQDFAKNGISEVKVYNPNNSEILKKFTVKEIVSNFNKAYPPKNNFQWSFEQTDPESFSMKQIDKNSPELVSQQFEKELYNIVKLAANDTQRLIITVNEINNIEIDNNRKIHSFTIQLQNWHDLGEKEKLVSFMRNIIKHYKLTYGENVKWSVKNNLVTDNEIILKRQ